MMNDPYAGGGADAAVYAEPQRTSIMAILALVCSLIGLVVCCIPGPEILGVLLAVISLVLIGGSGGRVGGKGLAIAALIIGVLMAIVKVGLYLMISAGVGLAAQNFDTLMTDLQARDFNGARTLLVSPAADISDDEMELFVATYEAEFGAYQSAPKGLFDYIASFVDPAVSSQMQGYTGTGSEMPVPATFDSGLAPAIMQFDQQAGPEAITDIIIIMPDGSELRLSEPGDYAP